MTIKEFALNTLVVALFVIVVIVAAFIEFHFVLHIDILPIHFLIPVLLGAIFGTLFVLSRHFYLKMKEKEPYEKIAKQDTLTGVMSRYACELILDFHMRQNHRLQTPFSILVIDVDNFKMINDTLGHDAGDKVLIELSHTVSNQLRDSDTLCRWGGEEFIVILSETPKNQVHEAARKVLKGIENYDFKIGKIVTVSIGIVCIDNAESSIEHYIKKADEALYCAKKQGKNCFVIAS